MSNIRYHAVTAAAVFTLFVCMLVMVGHCAPEPAVADPLPTPNAEYLGTLPGTDVRVWRERRRVDVCTYTVAKVMGGEAASVSCN